jgi:hypothetical protein
VSTSVLAAFLHGCVDACEAIPPRRTRRGNPASGPAESQLEEALFEALPAYGIPAHRMGARRVVVRDDWDPAPNGIDFYVWERPDAELALVAELKFDNVEERMWDLFKLLAARKLPGGPVAVLVHGGSWKRSRPCSELFPAIAGSTVAVDTLALVESNRTQWKRDLKYRGRVLVAPRSVRCTSHLAGVRLRSYPGYELRVVTVEPAGDEVLSFSDGWPLTHPR